MTPQQRGKSAPGRPMPKGRAIDPMRVLRRHWKGIPVWGAIGALFGAGVFFLFVRVYPLYTGEYLFEVRPGLGEATDIGTVDMSNDKMVARVAATQTVLIKNRAILQTAMKDRNMRETDWIKQFNDPATGLPDVDLAVDQLEEEIKTPVIRNTNLYGVRWSTHRAADVPILLRAVGDAYLAQVEALDKAVFRDNFEAFEDEGQRIRLSLQDLNDELQAYIRAKGITTLDDTRFSASMFETQRLTETLTTTRSQLTTVSTSYLQTAAKLEGTMEPSMEDRMEAERDPIVIRQMQTLEILESNLRALHERLSGTHPQVIDAEIAVRATEDQINSTLQDIIRRNLNAKLKALSDQRDQMLLVIEEVETGIEAKDGELRELAADQSQFEHMESTRKQLEAQRDENTRLQTSVRLMQLRADASRVRPAALPIEPRQRSFPRAEIMVPAGSVLFAAAFIGIVFLREMTDQKIRSASDVMIVPGAKVVGVLPDISEDPLEIESAELAVLHGSTGVFAESCRQAWVSVSRSMDAAAHQTLLLLSAAPEGGTTTVISNFAASAALAGRKICAIDCNFRRPRLATVFDLDDGSLGIGDLLTGSVEIDEAIQRAGCDVDVVSAGTPGNRIFDRLDSDRMKSLLAQLRDRYDVVLVDAPPSIVAGDALVLANHVDAISLVIRSDRDERGLIARVLRELGESRGSVLGETLNLARGTVGGYFRKNYKAMASYGESDAA